MKKSFFPTNNYHGMVRAIDALVNREPSMPGMGLIVGKWGIGKSEAIDYFYGESRIYYIRAWRLMKPRDLLEEICEEYRVIPEYRMKPLFKQTWKLLKQRNAPLVIDEADYLFKNKVNLDVVRDLYDFSRSPIVLVGMEQFYEKLESTGQFWSRILPAGIAEFKPLTPPEMILITEKWTGLKILPESAEDVCHHTEGDFRIIMGYLDAFEKACKISKTIEISSAMVETVKRKMERRISTHNHQRRKIEGDLYAGRKSIA